jgi:hypothetical protein
MVNLALETMQTGGGDVLKRCVEWGGCISFLSPPIEGWYSIGRSIELKSYGGSKRVREFFVLFCTHSSTHGAFHKYVSNCF